MPMLPMKHFHSINSKKASSFTRFCRNIFQRYKRSGAIKAIVLVYKTTEVLGDAGLLKQAETITLPTAEVALKEGIDADGVHGE